MFFRTKKRNKNTVTAEEILLFHNEYSKYHEFDVEMNAKNMATMLHPHWGYLCKFNVFMLLN